MSDQSENSDELSDDELADVAGGGPIEPAVTRFEDPTKDPVDEDLEGKVDRVQDTT